MTPSQHPAYLKKEISFTSILSSGNKGIQVRRSQEWLSYHGFQTTIDGSFGPATERACKGFQAYHHLPETGKIDQSMWELLIKPLVRSVSDVPHLENSFDTTCLHVAKQHLNQHPLELGGDNCGPWVRTYMNGHDGAEWFWCAGFVTFLMTQTAMQMGIEKPIPGSVSCDTLAAQATTAKRFISGGKVARGLIPASALGSTFIFLVPRLTGDWVHTGIGFDLQENTFSTIEGNTNDNGSRNGYVVCTRTRSIVKKDFITLA